MMTVNKAYQLLKRRALSPPTGGAGQSSPRQHSRNAGKTAFEIPEN
jgi:hypothetical protein